MISKIKYMPCSSDYLAASNQEIELSKVYQLLDVLDGKPLPKNYGDGYDDRAYFKATKSLLDEKVAELCEKCSKIEDITKYLLELQIWWRDHQKADKDRQEKDKGSYI